MKLPSLIILVLMVSVASSKKEKYLVRLAPHTDIDKLRELNPEIDLRRKFFKRTILLVVAKKKYMKQLEMSPDVEYVEKDVIITAHKKCNSVHTYNWGLDRIDQRKPLPKGLNFSAMQYRIGGQNGAGVDAYVVDSGIDVTHSEFEGRAKFVFAAEGMEDPELDGHGHGTHVAGTIGSRSFGVARDVNLLAVKVLDADNSGTLSGVIEALDWLERNAKPGRSVINMSLGVGGISQVMLDAVRSLYQHGLTVVVSAGNDDGNACHYSPAACDRAITVGATNITDGSASFTNWGSCVDVFAPGVQIISTLPGGNIGIGSGTSMAAPHVAGAIARYMTDGPKTPAKVEIWVKNSMTLGAISWHVNQHRRSPNALLYAPCKL